MKTLHDVKKDSLSLIEEISDSEKLTDDPDIEKKLNSTIYNVSLEVARMKKIPARATVQIDDTLELDLNSLPEFYQLDNIRFTNVDGEETEVDVFGNFVEFPEEGTAKVYYFKYPKAITDDTIDTDYIFELSEDALGIIPYGVAADLLKSDVSNNYGQIYAQRYNEMLQRLDPRYSMGSIYIEGGLI